MYESFFGLRKRPFAAAPDADVCVETPAVADAIRRLDLCVRQGCGVAVLTAAAGLGKTLLCQRLARGLGGAFYTVLLPNAGFPTRRGLLQAILAELGQPYQRLGETELRLELTAAARSARGDGRGLVLLFDEAHRYSERVLEEIRLVANLVEGGEPLVRIVLAGHVELEDKLADPALAGLNERVGELVTLPRLTADESRWYLRDRAVFAGAPLDSLFTPDAVELIVRACGGVPRCLNQLADHALLLGYVAERRPVGEGLVREALDDLKRLPLQWYDPLPTSAAASSAEDTGTFSIESEPSGVIEIGELSEADAGASDAFELPEPEPEAAIEQAPTAEEVPARAEPSPPMPSRLGSLTIVDRFARIDAAEASRRWFEALEESEREPSRTEQPEPAAPAARTATAERPAVNPLEILDRIEPLVAESLAEETFHLTPTGESDAAVAVAQRVSIDRFVAALEPVAIATSVAPSATTAAPAGEPRTERRYSTLFRDLRRRRER